MEQELCLIRMEKSYNKDSGLKENFNAKKDKKNEKKKKRAIKNILCLRDNLFFKKLNIILSCICD